MLDVLVYQSTKVFLTKYHHDNRRNDECFIITGECWENNARDCGMYSHGIPGLEVGYMKGSKHIFYHHDSPNTNLDYHEEREANGAYLIGSSFESSSSISARYGGLFEGHISLRKYITGGIKNTGSRLFEKVPF